MWGLRETSFGNLDENFKEVRAQYTGLNKKKELLLKEKHKLDNAELDPKMTISSGTTNNKSSNFIISRRFNQSKDNLVNIKNYKNLNVNHILSSVASDNEFISNFMKQLSQKKKKIKLKSINKVLKSYNNEKKTKKLEELFENKSNTSRQKNNNNNNNPSFIFKTDNCIKKNLTSFSIKPYNIVNKVNYNNTHNKKNTFNTEIEKFKFKDTLNQIRKSGANTINCANRLRRNIEVMNNYYLKTYQDINNSNDGDYIVIGGKKYKDDIMQRKIHNINYYDKFYKNFKDIKDVENNILKTSSNIYKNVRMKLFNKYKNKIKNKNFANDIISVE